MRKSLIELVLSKARTLTEANKFLDRIERLSSVLNVKITEPQIAKSAALVGVTAKQAKTIFAGDERRYGPIGPMAPSNHGKRWSKRDRMVLEAKFQDGASDADIAKALGRTEVSVLVQRTKMELFRGGAIVLPKIGDKRVNGAA